MKKIIIISGDPNSINSEIIFKSWKKLSKTVKKKIYLISNYKLLKEQFKILGYKAPIEKVDDINDSNNTNLKVVNVDLKFKKPFKVNATSTSKFILDSLNLGHKLALDKERVLGLINCSIDKKHLRNKYRGVTEYFADKCKTGNSEVMLIRNEKLSVSPITTHINVKKISKNIDKLKIIKKVKLIDFWFKKICKKKPNIAVLGLNPHNAELRNSSEEKKIIIPAIFRLKKMGIKVKGPMVADTIFINNFKKFDVIVGMYHDQVIAPFKTLYKFNAINITLGLTYLRISPDHGTAKDIICKKKANPLSLLKCINTVLKIG